MGEKNSESNGTGLQYVFGVKDELLLIVFSGKMTGRELPILEKFESEIQAKTQSIVLFSFKDVSSVMPAAHSTLTRVQKAIRDQGKVIGLCSLKVEYKKTLLMSGIIRESEIFNDPASALPELKARFEAAKKSDKSQKAS